MSAISDAAATAPVRGRIAQPVAWSDETVARPRHVSRSVNLSHGFDAVWAAAITGTFLFSFALGSFALLSLFGLVALFFIVRHRAMPRILLSLVPLMALPGFAMASTIWSIVPGTTAYYGFQYFVTAFAGMLLGAGTKRREAIYGMFVAVALHAVLSFVGGRYVEWGGDFGGAVGGGVAFAGLMGSKNAAADAAAIGTMLSLATLGQAIRDKRLLFILAAGGVVLIDLWILYYSRSTGALLSAAIATMALLAMMAGRLLPSATRMAIFILVALTVVGAAATQDLWLKPLMSEVLQAAGKDATLTGRTYIWDRGDRLIRANPELGIGYNAFWRHGNIEAEGIWRYADITNRSGFNFHNTPRELMVHIGIVGLILYGAVAGIMFTMLMARTTQTPTSLAIFACAYLSYVAIRLNVESVAFSPISHGTFFIFTALACAVWRPDPRGRPEAIARR